MGCSEIASVQGRLSAMESQIVWMEQERNALEEQHQAEMQAARAEFQAAQNRADALQAQMMATEQHARSSPHDGSPVAMDPMVLALQQQLATATEQHAILIAEAERQVRHLEAEVETLEEEKEFVIDQHTTEGATAQEKISSLQARVFSMQQQQQMTPDRADAKLSQSPVRIDHPILSPPGGWGGGSSVDLSSSKDFEQATAPEKIAFLNAKVARLEAERNSRTDRHTRDAFVSTEQIHMMENRIESMKQQLNRAGGARLEEASQAMQEQAEQLVLAQQWVSVLEEHCHIAEMKAHSLELAVGSLEEEREQFAADQQEARQKIESLELMIRGLEEECDSRLHQESALGGE